MTMTGDFPVMFLSQQAPPPPPETDNTPEESGGIMGFLTSMKESAESFLHSDGFGGIVQTILVLLGIIIAIAVIAIMSRYVVRWVHNYFRSLMNGKMVYNEIIYEGVVGGEGPRSIDLTHNMRNLMFAVKPGLEVYFSRPQVTIVIRNSEDDDSAHMFVGISKKHYDHSRLTSWATGMNCSLESVDVEDIGIITGAPAIAVVDRAEASNITDQPTNYTIGQVMSRIQEMTSTGVGGTIMLTFEPMRSGEGKLLINHVAGAAVKAGGSHMELDKGTRNTSVVTSNSPSRAVLATFSDNGDQQVSNSLIDLTISNIANLGWSLSTTTPQRRHMRTGWMALPGSFLLLLLSVLDSFPWWLSITVAVINLSVIMGLPWMSSFWVSLAAKKGALAIPPFFRYSLRRIATQRLLEISKFDIDSEQLGRNYVAQPSMPEVIPMYQTSMMQLTTMPTTGVGSINVASSAVPQVPMASSVLSDIDTFISNGDVIYTGMSAKSHEPVYRTAKDVNFGIALGGDAGSGKTNALMNDFLGMSRLSRKTNGIAGKMRINPCWFESKADDLGELIGMVKPYNPSVVKVHDAQSPSRLTLEGPRLGDEGVTIDQVTENINLMIDTMEAIWGGGSFGPRSRQIANSALTMAMLLKEDEIEKIFEGRVKNPDRPNIIHVMGLIVGTDPSIKIDERITEFAKDYGATLSDKTRKRLREVIAGMTKEEAKAEVRRRQTLQVAMDSMVNMYNIRDAIAPLQNKLPQLMFSEGLFNPYTEDGVLREEHSIDDFLTYGGPVIVDLTAAGSTMTTTRSRMFVMMIHYMVWQRLQKIAGGWAKEGKFTPIYVDEVTNFTGDKESDVGEGCANIIAEVRDQGRSYGVSHNVGFQNFRQMPDRVRAAVLSFQSLILLQFGNHEDINVIMNIMGEDSRYSANNVLMFPQGIGIARMVIGGTRRTPFTIKTPHIVAWSKALSKSRNSVSDAFDMIRDGEIKYLRREKKKKVDTNTVLTQGDRYESDYDNTVSSDYYGGGRHTEDDDEMPLSWD